MTSAAWSQRRQQWLEEWQAAHDGNDPCCAVCAAPWTLHHGCLHHRSYQRLGAEHHDDLTPLCAADHRHLHVLLESIPGWRRLPRHQATDILVAVLRAQHHKEAEHD
jgi:hypothetical protein